MAKYELISKDALDKALHEIQLARNLSSNDDVLNTLNTAYLTIQENRSPCNVRPEGA